MLAAALSVSSAAASFTGSSCHVPALARPAVHTILPVMNVEETSSRRQLFARAGAAVLGGAIAQSASAKAGQFGKVDIFGYAISSPYFEGGPKTGPEATFGLQKSAGPFVAAGYEQDVTREKAAFEVSAKIIRSQGPNIESKTWWLTRDNLRGQAYNMKANMLALNKVSKNKAAADKAYAKFWSEVDQLDLACTKKELALAQKEYKDVLSALDAYVKTV